MTLNLKIPIKGSSPKKFQSMVPNSGFYRFLSTPSAASVDCANSDRVSHGFLFLTVPCVPCQQLASPLENEECIIALSAQFTTEALLRHSFFQVILYSYLVLQLELGHFSESSLVHSQLTVHKIKYDFLREGFCCMELPPTHEL